MVYYPAAWHYVTVYGADPTGVRDSTAAIQAAVNACTATSGGVVYFPAGTYKLTAAVTLVSGVTLLGDGSRVSVLSQSSTTANGLTGTDVANVTIRGLAVAGPGSGSGIGASFTLSGGTSTPYLRFDDVKISAFGSHGLAASTPIVSSFTLVNAASNGGDGFHVTGGGTSCTFDSCYANSNAAYGYNLNNLHYSALNGCACDSNANGYLLTSCLAVALTGCGAEGTTTDNFILTGGHANALVSCRCFHNAHYGVHIAGGETGAQVLGFQEDTPSGAANSIITDSGTKAFITGYVVTTAVSFASQTCTNVDSSGNLSVAGTSFLSTTQVFAPLAVKSAGSGLQVAEGSNAKQGTATLSSGAVVVANTSVTANSRILLTSNTDGGTPGWLRVSARTAGTSFTITSSSGTDTSVVAYQIFEPA